MHIQYLTQDDIPAWDAYVQKHPQGTVFHTCQWKSVIEKTFAHKNHYLITKNSTGAITGGLPLFHIKSPLFGNFLVSVPFAELGGPLSDTPEIQTVLVNKAKSIAERCQCDYVELRNQTPIHNLKTKDLYVNFKREIFPELDDNLMAIPRKARRMIRQGEKLGLTYAFGVNQIKDFYNIMCSSYHQLGTPIFTLRLFQNLIHSFGDQCEILMIRTKEGDSAAGVLSLFYKDQALPYYAGSKFEHRQLAPNDFMYWQLMKYAWEKGCKVFDFGRSKIDTGSYHFKRHWGFEPKPLAYQYQLIRSGELPNLSPTNPKYTKKIEYWKKLPLWATRIIGPPIAKYLA